MVVIVHIEDSETVKTPRRMNDVVARCSLVNLDEPLLVRGNQTKCSLDDHCQVVIVCLIEYSWVVADELNQVDLRVVSSLLDSSLIVVLDSIESCSVIQLELALGNKPR